VIDTLELSMHGSAANPKFDIVDTARSEASFTIFLGTLRTVSYMVDYLKGAGPFTVFMPTDQAFEALAPGTIQELQKPENHERLKNILKGHIAKGLHSSSELKSMQALETESGRKLMIESSGSGLKINNAMLLGRDIVCTNGLIHAIEAVQLDY